MLHYPLAPDTLHFDRFFCVFANLVYKVLSTNRILLAQTPQACRSSSRIVTIVFQIVVTIFSIVYDGGPSLRSPRDWASGHTAG
jgi:hypothetical protein